MTDSETLTTEDYTMLLQFVNSINIPGSLAERVVDLKRKLADQIRREGGR